MTAATDQNNDPSQQNLFGICARVGEDFGFNPLWLRLAFAGALIFNPVAVIGAYFALGALVLTSRILFPKRPRKAAAVPAAAAANTASPATLEDVPAPIRDHAAQEARLPLAA